MVLANLCMANSPQSSAASSNTPTSDESHDQNTNSEPPQTLDKPTRPKENLKSQHGKFRGVKNVRFFGFLVSFLNGLEIPYRVAIQVEFFKNHFPSLFASLWRLFHHSNS
jgi:hypothetical protein